ncbi:hypothetical protein D3C79_1035210 [compost metagenome]
MGAQVLGPGGHLLPGGGGNALALMAVVDPVKQKEDHQNDKGQQMLHHDSPRLLCVVPDLNAIRMNMLQEPPRGDCDPLRVLV